MKRRKKTAKFPVILVCIIAVALLATAMIFANGFNNKGLSSSAVSSTVSREPEKKPILKAKVLAVGDMLLHSTVLSSAKKADNSYDFNPMFENVKSIISSADLSICNLDGVMAGESYRYTGYPAFNAPDSFANAMKNTGFDVVVNMNNHSFDRSFKGLMNSIDTLKKEGLIPLGVRQSAEEKNYTVKEVNGIKIGIIAYSYETDPDVAKVSLNGILVPAANAPLLNVFSPQNYKNELEIMKASIEKMNAESDFSIIYIHWGDEYKREPNAMQKAMAKEFVSMGIDVVFGDHPHVIEPYEYIKAENGNEGHIFYSLGNFISDQRKMPSAAAYCEDGVITTVEFTLDQNTNKAFVSDIDYTPTWVNKVGTSFHILPVEPSLELQNAFNNETLACLTRSKSNTDAVLNTVTEANAIIKGVK